MQPNAARWRIRVLALGVILCGARHCVSETEADTGGRHRHERQGDRGVLCSGKRDSSMDGGSARQLTEVLLVECDGTIVPAPDGATIASLHDWRSVFGERNGTIFYCSRDPESKSNGTGFERLIAPVTNGVAHGVVTIESALPEGTVSLEFRTMKYGKRVGPWVQFESGTNGYLRLMRTCRFKDDEVDGEFVLWDFERARTTAATIRHGSWDNLQPQDSLMPMPGGEPFPSVILRSTGRPFSTGGSRTGISGLPTEDGTDQADEKINVPAGRSFLLPTKLMP